MSLAKIRSRTFPSFVEFDLFVRSLPLRELVADTAGRYLAAELFGKKLRERIGNPSKLPPPLASATLEARRAGKGYYAQVPMPGTRADSTLQWTGRYKRSISCANVGPRETGVGSDDEKAVWFEFGTPKMPRREPMAGTAREHNDEAFVLYAETLVTKMFNL